MTTPTDDDEALLARCIDRLSVLGPDAVDEVCGGDAAQRTRLLDRLAALERLGLVSGSERPAAPPSIGPHRVIDFLGQGGMGEVYLGLDERRGCRVAIKLGHVPLAARGSGEVALRARARFEREIRAVARLEHPGIVAIHDVGESDGRPYFTMDFVEGTTLARIVEEIRERGLGFDELSVALLREIVGAGDRATEEGSWGTTYVETVCRWAVEIADALGHAHANAIVHRDVKPANVMIRRDGRAMLFDLGLASVAEEPALTRTGDLAGSPFYMSPEQVTGPPGRVDRRTDVYSLGVTLFELLALRRPFEGPTSVHVFRQITHREPPSLRRLNPMIPRDLETICLTALEKDPERRYPSMAEFAADLRRFLAFQPVRAKPAGVLRRSWRFARRNPATATALLLAGLVLVGLPIGLLWANAAIRGEERRATREAYLKSKVTDFLVDQFELTEADRAKGATISARELLDRGVERLEGAFEEDPLVRSELYAATGAVYQNLGLSERAIPLLDRALAIRQSADVDDRRAQAELLNELATAHLSAGHPETARRLCERGLELLEKSAGAPGSDAARLHRTLAEAAGLMGDHATVERSLSLALGVLRGQGAEEVETAEVLERLGVVALDRGEPARARPRLSEALGIRKGAWAPDVAGIARVLVELARVDDALGDRAQADAERTEAARYGVATSLAPAPDPLPFVVDSGAKPEYDATFQTGITALQSRELDRAIAAFRRCLEIDPSRSVCAYNVACGYALAGDVEHGIEWLDRAATMGFGVAPYRLRVAETDPEIANLRDDPRGRAVLERIRRHAEQVRAFAAAPGIALSPAASRGEAGPLLVVLHAEGRTPAEVVAGPWGVLARDLGATLLAPSGSIPTIVEPGDGMTWFEDPRDLVRKPLDVEQTVEDAVRPFLVEHAVDRDRIWIAGEGAGAMVAFDVALRAPGLYRAVVLVGGPIHPGTSPDRARRAASLGLRTAYVVAEPIATPEVGARVRRWLETCGFVDPTILEPRPADAAVRIGLLRSVFESRGG
ncbi:MAG TPA: protein kinase [Planctomycetota bacterium]|jgi:serine/threonine protein kinase/predicted esterase|nr:protein kinase [Planctomycetota bacterium]